MKENILEEFKVKWTGEQPLIMHRGDLADPLDQYSKLISAQAKRAKKDKTELQYMELYRLEWLGGMYTDPEFGIVVPTDNILKVIIEGARRAKRGKLVESSVFVSGIEPNGHAESVKLDYPGEHNVDKMWEQSCDGKAKFIFKRTLKVAQTRIVRCRPIFYKWGVTFSIKHEPAAIQKDELFEAMEVAGRMIGMGDWHPRYGTFKVEEVK